MNRDDRRALSLRQRKHALERIDAAHRLRFMEHIEGRGVDLFRVACDRALEGSVGKWTRGSYLTDGRATARPIECGHDRSWRYADERPRALFASDGRASPSAPHRTDALNVR
jgi:bifunctional non-homologous end joining protein LigD